MNFGLISGLLIGGIAIVASIVVPLILLKGFSGLMSGLSGPSFAGSAMSGTARISAVQTTGASIQRGGHPPAYQCQIALRVEIPGRQPYDVMVRQLVDTVALPAVQPGATVAVQVDSANSQNVRIDFNQPITSARPPTVAG
ncbi:MAG: hypothetical protein JO259_01500 [Mycobacterium sp.]|nr:hypothetical protein [Mycobacterium sp.]